MFNLNSKQTFVVVLVILLGIFLAPVITAFTGHNLNGNPKENGKPIKPEIVYVHDTIVKHDTIVRVDTVYIHNQK